MIATTIKQSAHLLKLGLPKETADMHYYWEIVKTPGSSGEFEPFLGVGPTVKDSNVPAWSVGRLMEMLPARINGAYLDSSNLHITKNGEEWEVFYCNHDEQISSRNKSLINAVYGMMRELLVKGKLNLEGVK